MNVKNGIKIYSKNICLKLYVIKTNRQKHSNKIKQLFAI